MKKQWGYAILALLLTLGCLKDNPVDDTTNNPPVFASDSSSMGNSVLVGSTYVDTLHATDSDGDGLIFSLLEGVSGLTLLDSVLTWSPATTDTGSHTIKAQACDGNGGCDTVAWSVTVATPTDRPTGRVVTGKMVDANGTPISGAVVRMFPIDYVPSFASAKRMAETADTTNSQGVYYIPTGDSGSYNIEGEKDTLGVFVDSVEVGSDTNDVSVPDATMKKIGMITGISHMAGKDDTTQIRITIYMPGTRRITKPSIGGRFTFNNMPEGQYQLIFDPTLNDFDVQIIDTSVAAADTLDLDTIRIPTFVPDTVDIKTTSVSGTWKPASIYRIYSDIEIPVGATLTVLPGTKVLFMGDFMLRPQGTLISNGTPDSLIEYKYGFDNGKWNRIRVSSIADSVSISYSVIENSIYGLNFEESTLRIVISNNVFRYNSCSGINLHNCFNGIEIYHNVFHSITGSQYSRASAIKFYVRDQNYNATIRNNILVSCSTGTLIQYGDHDVLLTLDNNCYHGNDADFMKYDSPTYTPFSPTTSGHVTANPKFVSLDKGNENYHLQADSPCKGTGINGTDMGIYSTYDGQ